MNFRQSLTQWFRDSLKPSTSAGGTVMSHCIFSDQDFNNILHLVTPKSPVTWPALITLTCLLQQSSDAFHH